MCMQVGLCTEKTTFYSDIMYESTVQGRQLNSSPQLSSRISSLSAHGYLRSEGNAHPLRQQGRLGQCFLKNREVSAVHKSVTSSAIAVWPADLLRLNHAVQIDPNLSRLFICVEFPGMSPGQALPASLQRPLGAICEVHGAGGTTRPCPSVRGASWRGLQHPPRNCSQIVPLEQ